MINDGVKIVSLTEQISLMVKESIEDFIIETIEPYCSEVAEIKISKEELKKVILKCKDCVSRAEALKNLALTNSKDDVYKMIQELPPVIPKKE